MALGIKSLPEIEVESLSDGGSLGGSFVFGTDFYIFIMSVPDYIAAEACEDNTLLSDVNTSFFHHIWVTFKAPEYLWIQFMVKSHELFVI